VLLYSRELPSGGIVLIESDSGETGLHHAFVSVERRADPLRRAGHHPPIIAEAHAPSRVAVLRELYSIASDNMAISQALVRWQTDR
jgi:hypothetical protein